MALFNPTRLCFLVRSGTGARQTDSSLKELWCSMPASIPEVARCANDGAATAPRGQHPQTQATRRAVGALSSFHNPQQRAVGRGDCTERSRSGPRTRPPPMASTNGMGRDWRLKCASVRGCARRRQRARRPSTRCSGRPALAAEHSCRGEVGGLRWLDDRSS